MRMKMTMAFLMLDTRVIVVGVCKQGENPLESQGVIQ